MQYDPPEYISGPKAKTAKQTEFARELVNRFLNGTTVDCIYKSQKSIALREKLGPFNYDETEGKPDDVKCHKEPRKQFIIGRTEKTPQGSSGWEYEGESSLEGKRHGKGAMVWTVGSFYEGWWKNDKQHGQGRLIYCNINSGAYYYEGAWKYGKKDGYGVERYSNGTYYKGSWKEGKRHGEGIIKQKSGEIKAGIWNMDNLQQYTDFLGLTRMNPQDENPFDFLLDRFKD